MKKIGIYIIATNNYVKLLDELFFDLNRIYQSNNNFDITINLATDNSTKIEEQLAQFKGLNFNIIGIKSYNWPEATLFRYEIISRFNNIFDFNYCIYLDCDMKIHEDFLEDSEFISDKRLTLVKHPAFNFDKTLLGIFYAFTSPTFVFNYVKSLAYQPFKLGAWEREKKSLARVPYFKRNIYVHGAVWFGPPLPFYNVCRQLALRTDSDYRKEIIAVWHDESHLNWYSSQNDVNIISSEYSWVNGYRNLKHIKPKISSLEPSKKQKKLLG